MKYFFSVILLFLMVQGAIGQHFVDFIQQLQSAPEAERQALVDAFMDTVSSIPFTEQDTIANFIYQGTANTVSVAGDATVWNPNMLFMSSIPGTHFWYKTAYYEADARLDYKIVLNGNNWILDPLNPYTCMGGFGPNSELRMPLYEKPPEIEYHANIPHGSLFDTTFFSSQLGNSRTVVVYLPPGYDDHKTYSMVLFHDGTDYINLGNAPIILDNLINDGSIDSIVGVFIPPVNRNPEYSGNDQDAYTSFIIDDIMPWLKQRFHIAPQAHRHLVMGASNGGNISLWIAMTHPEEFMYVAAQSSNIQAKIADRFGEDPVLNLKLYLDLGLYDLPVLQPLVRNFIPILENKGYTHTYNEYPEGHSWGFWKAHLDDILKYFFPLATSDINSHIERKKKVRVSPNPFREKVRFLIDVNETNTYELLILDANGRLVEMQNFRGEQGSKHTLWWQAHNSMGAPLGAGCYVYYLTMDHQVLDSGKLVLTGD